ncbi:hypothetical protein ElyMa_003757500 [Elysia marginata]|uniref:Uncharacterized protein n=1 Tax=Elysia marginata TaxID=1093978 RepID=A0AAV4F866_9GAST|nr:hypothetical protein ElyMa_003757500 [Elysia marginata]
MNVIPRCIQDQVIRLTRKYVVELQEGDEGASYSGRVDRFRCRGGWSSPEREHRPCRDRSEGRASCLEGYDGYARTRYVSPERRTGRGVQLLVQEAVHSMIHNVPGVVENVEDEQLEPKLSGIQEEEAKRSNTINSESPWGGRC